LIQKDEGCTQESGLKDLQARTQAEFARPLEEIPTGLVAVLIYKLGPADFFRSAIVRSKVHRADVSRTQIGPGCRILGELNEMAEALGRGAFERERRP
jgi:hypothetical protein